MNYTKPPLDIESQILHIEAHYTIKCKDRDLLKNDLLHTNYYKLRGYWLFYEEIKQEVFYEEIINLYEFDKKLRMLFLEYIEIVESSLKSMFTNHLTVKYDNPHIHLDSSLFENKIFYSYGIIQLANSFKNSKELFIKHFKHTYDEELPPLWVCAEFMTLGEISKWFKNLKLEDKKEIVKRYEGYLPLKSFETFLVNLTEVRNVSAHHSRLWNRSFSKKFSIPKRLDIDQPDRFQIYHTAVMLDFMLDKITDRNHFLKHFIELIIEHGIPLKYMGFPEEHMIEALKGFYYE